ncbi:cyclin-T1-like [Ptychodera flava]|uniref:cyclin-T1-like n=1 Tax=Ptychodera flava TaxID=63121 RepID=UPI003969E4BF
MAVDPERWYFTKDQLMNSPSRRHGVDPEKELSYRQQAANLIQDMGQRLSVTQLCINTAIMYMHRFYMHHSFSKFHRNSIAPTALFLAAKVEEQPRKLEHVVRVAHLCLNREAPQLDPQSEAYLEKAQEIVILESILLQTLGFNVAIDHPHTYVVKCTQLIRANKDLAQTAYFMATNSLHLTTFSLQYKPTQVACVCIHLACKWSNWEIPLSSDGKHWWEYVDNSVDQSKLDALTSEFVQIMDRCPSRLKRKIHISKSNIQPSKKIKNEPSSAESSPGITPMASLATKTDPAQPSTSKMNAKLSNHDRQGKPDLEKELKAKLEAQLAHKEHKERGKNVAGKDKTEPNTAHLEHKEHKVKSGEHLHRQHHAHGKDRKHSENRHQHVKHGAEHQKSSSEPRHHSAKVLGSEPHTSASSEHLRVGVSEHQQHRQHAELMQRSQAERRPHSAEHLPPGSKDSKHYKSHHQRNPSEPTPNGTKITKERLGKSEHKERPLVNPAAAVPNITGHSSSKERDKYKPDHHHHHHHHHHHRHQQKHHSSSSSSGEKRSAPHSQKPHSSSALAGKRPHSPSGRIARLQPHTKNPEGYQLSLAKRAVPAGSSHVSSSPSKQSGLTLPSNQSLLRLPMPPPEPTQLAETDILQQALSAALMNESSGSESGRADPGDLSMFFSHHMPPQHQPPYFTSQPPLPMEVDATQPPLPPGPPPPPLPHENPPPLPPLPPPP